MPPRPHPPEVHSFVILPPATQRAIREKHARDKQRLEPDEAPHPPPPPAGFCKADGKTLHPRRRS